MSVIIIEDGNEGLGIYRPEVEAVEGESVTIFNKSSHNIKIYDPNGILEDPLKPGKSISGKVIKAEATCKYRVRANVADGVYGYAVFAEISGNYEFLDGIYGTPRIIIVS